MLCSCHIFLLLIVIGFTSGAANNSYQNCLQVAARFATTVPNGPVPDIRATQGFNVSCPQLSNVSCPGSMINGVCVFQQKLCVTCINGSTVRIRVQSNGLPRRCMLVPLTAQIAEINVDFEVNFNPDVSVNSPNQSPTTTAAVSTLLCNITNQASVPATSAFTMGQYSMPQNALAGIAVDGVEILNANSMNAVDPFYPTGGYPAEGADQCISHPAGSGEFHYHIASGCMVNPPAGNLTGCSPEIGCLNNVANYSLKTFSSYKTLTVIGIAKDGHVIYGPYDSSGQQVTSGFDVCNGMFYDSIGNYAYFATTTYPYITGCFGPGNYPNAKPNCTANPVQSYTKSSYAALMTTSTGTTSPIQSYTNSSYTASMTTSTTTTSSPQSYTNSSYSTSITTLTGRSNSTQSYTNLSSAASMTTSTTTTSPAQSYINSTYIASITTSTDKPNSTQSYTNSSSAASITTSTTTTSSPQSYKNSSYSTSIITSTGRTNSTQSYTKSSYTASMTTSTGTTLNVLSSIINFIAFFIVFMHMIIIN
ncbi:unnamed protein product [Adineta steineri]|uniref:YHYH domain-containing protein n=1 Tax=Adineta steineri TaxID=433720 RepID=A0A819XAW9_9BILA|nr:unnamed protein product [Adineta steineri]CAF1310109.1 unnamed protein product [Adineta steineri]CAF3533964.1 unnamed protein product [Adineta steineri]CAF4138007.1 unnamed protein product [Adineta steineri]